MTNCTNGIFDAIAGLKVASERDLPGYKDELSAGKQGLRLELLDSELFLQLG